MSRENEPLSADKVVEELKKCGITHIVYLPDRETKFIHDAVKDYPDFTIIPVCREGEAIAIAAGLILGGKEPLVMHQNTGFFETGDSVRSLALDIQLPLLLLIGYRGWQRRSPITDSAAVFIEPILDAWGIQHYLLETNADAWKISAGYVEAHETLKPVALLLGKEHENDD